MITQVASVVGILLVTLFALTVVLLGTSTYIGLIIW